MRTYNGVIQNLKKLLNHKGRNGNGFNSQKEFIKILTELKEDFNKEVSTTFLINLMDNRKTHRQKSQKVRDLSRGCEKEKRNKYTRGLKVVVFKTEIINYGFKKGYTAQKNHRNRKVKIPKIKASKQGFIYIDYLHQKDLRDIGDFICESKGINFNIKSQDVAREFVGSERKTFNFIKV